MCAQPSAPRERKKRKPEIVMPEIPAEIKKPKLEDYVATPDKPTAEELKALAEATQMYLERKDIMEERRRAQSRVRDKKRQKPVLSQGYPAMPPCRTARV